MIYKFRVLSNEIEDFLIDIDISSTQTFFDFHKAIQETTSYDKAQMCSFFISDENWEKGKEITLFDMGDENNSDKLIMEKTVLSEYLEEKGQRLLYVFDFFSERAFFVELVQSIKENNETTDFPLCVESKGVAPEQIKIDSSVDNISDFDDDDFDEEWSEDISFDELDDFSENDFY